MHRDSRWLPWALWLGLGQLESEKNKTWPSGWWSISNHLFLPSPHLYKLLIPEHWILWEKKKATSLFSFSWDCLNMNGYNSWNSCWYTIPLQQKSHYLQVLLGNEDNIQSEKWGSPVLCIRDPLSFVSLVPLDSVNLSMLPSNCRPGWCSQFWGSWALARLVLYEDSFFGPTVMLNCSIDIPPWNSFFLNTNCQAILLDLCIQALHWPSDPIPCPETLPRISGTRCFICLFPFRSCSLTLVSFCPTPHSACPVPWCPLLDLSDMDAPSPWLSSLLGATQVSCPDISHLQYVTNRYLHKFQVYITENNDSVDMNSQVRTKRGEDMS